MILPLLKKATISAVVMSQSAITKNESYSMAASRRHSLACVFGAVCMRPFA